MMRLVKHWSRLPKEPGNIQGQVRSDSEQTDSIENLPVYCKGLDWMTLNFSHTIL